MSSSVIQHSQETTKAVRNMMALGGSLMGTLLVAFAVRFWLPRYLGPDAFGKLHFAEAFATGFLVFTSFGMDTYIGKEVSTRLSHASDFFGALVCVRVLASCVLAAVMGWVLYAMNRTELTPVVLLFACWQMVFVLNSTLSSINSASGSVGSQAWINVGSKVLWGVSTVVGVSCGGGLYVIAACFFVSECVRACLLYRLVSAQTGLHFRCDMPQFWAVFMASMPFFLNVIATRMYDKIDVSMMAALVSDREVGWYAAASNIAGISLLFVPVVHSVVFPMAAKIVKQGSMQALDAVMQGAMRWALTGSMVVCMLLVIHAHDIVRTLFDVGFAPSGAVLRTLAPMFPLTYLCVLLGMHLIQSGKGWKTTMVSLSTLMVNPLLNYILIVKGVSLWGEGGGARGAAWAMVLSECFTVVCMTLLLKRQVLNASLWVHVLKLVPACAVMWLVWWCMKDVSVWWVQAFVEGVCYAVVACVLGVIPMHMLVRRFRPTAVV